MNSRMGEEEGGKKEREGGQNVCVHAHAHACIWVGMCMHVQRVVGGRS